MRHLILALILSLPLPAFAGFKVKKTGTWQRPPGLYVCKSAPVSRTVFDRAVRAFTDRGFTFRKIVFDVPCTRVEPRGAIRVFGADKLPRNNPGRTNKRLERRRRGPTYITQANILLRHGGFTVMAHELGHALGFEHTKRKGHIMFKNNLGVGDSFDGMNP